MVQFSPLFFMFSFRLVGPSLSHIIYFLMTVVSFNAEGFICIPNLIITFSTLARFIFVFTNPIRIKIKWQLYRSSSRVQFSELGFRNINCFKYQTWSSAINANRWRLATKRLQILVRNNASWAGLSINQFCWVFSFLGIRFPILRNWNNNQWRNRSRSRIKRRREEGGGRREDVKKKKVN